MGNELTTVFQPLGVGHLPRFNVGKDNRYKYNAWLYLLPGFLRVFFGPMVGVFFPELVERVGRGLGGGFGSAFWADSAARRASSARYRIR